MSFLAVWCASQWEANLEGHPVPRYIIKGGKKKWRDDDMNPRWPLRWGFPAPANTDYEMISTEILYDNWSQYEWSKEHHDPVNLTFEYSE